MASCIYRGESVRLIFSFEEFDVSRITSGLVTVVKNQKAFIRKNLSEMLIPYQGNEIIVALSSEETALLEAGNNWLCQMQLVIDSDTRVSKSFPFIVNENYNLYDIDTSED